MSGIGQLYQHRASALAEHVNRQLIALGSQPVKGRIERARTIVEGALPLGCEWEFIHGPTGPIEIEITGFADLGVNERFEQ